MSHKRPGYVYLAYDAVGQLLYVGSTSDVPQRVKEHERQSPWWPQVTTVEVEGPFPWRVPAYARETKLIHRLRPSCNRRPGPPPGPVRLTPRRTAEAQAMDERIVALRGAGLTRDQIMAETGLTMGGLQDRLKRLLRAGRSTS